MAVIWSGGPLTPAGIAQYVRRLSAPRPGTGTAITRPTEDRLRLLAPSRPFVRRKITVATRQRRYRSGSPCPRKASAQSDPRRRLYLLFINKLSLVLSLCIKRESFIHLGCRGDY